MSNEKIKRGSFHSGSEILHSTSGDHETASEEVAIRESFIQVLDKFKVEFAMPERIFYPACGNDASVIYAFKDDEGVEIVYLDPADTLLSVQRFVSDKNLRSNVRFFQNKIQDFEGDEQLKDSFDLLIHIHSHAPFEQELASLKVGGYLIISAKGSDRALDSDNLKLQAAIHFVEVDGKITAIFDNDTDKYYELDPNPPELTFSNKRKIKARFYIFRKER